MDLVVVGLGGTLKRLQNVIFVGNIADNNFHSLVAEDIDLFFLCREGVLAGEDGDAVEGVAGVDDGGDDVRPDGAGGSEDEEV